MKMTFGRNEKFKCSLLGYTEKEERRSQMEPGQWVQGANPTLMNGKSRGTGEARSPFKPIMGEHLSFKKFKIMTARAHTNCLAGWDQSKGLEIDHLSVSPFKTVKRCSELGNNLGYPGCLKVCLTALPEGIHKGGLRNPIW